MYLPIPSLKNKYEINQYGGVRNAITKKHLKSFVRNNESRKVPSVRVFFEGRRKECSIQQLLWEVHGKIPQRKARQPLSVTICNSGERLFFPSLNKAAIFLSRKVHYTKEWISQHLAKRVTEFHGWQIIYHEQEERKLRSVDAILETRRFSREKILE